ncbi:hypothetical protein [Paenibacillus barengoltzii]|jgi:hypothetical protein|uniref:hypothetical protein n=2 Tax=Paenibacillus barengoltzii TaxID=343517 RepID=UPI002FDA036A
MMNLSNRKILQNIALSTLLVSAIAGPTAASAKEAAGPDEVAQTVAIPAIATVKFEDPAALAKQYAPETATAWSNLLKKYEELAVKSTPTAIDIKLAPTPNGTVPADGQGVQFINVTKGQEGFAVKLKGGLHITGARVPEGTRKGEMVTLTTVTPIADDLLQGQIDLGKAVESKDTKAIQSALADLFELYEAEIAKLEQVKSE